MSIEKDYGKNKIVRLKLVRTYGEICMLGGNITLENYITLHHILKKALGGKTTINNGALVCDIFHKLLHSLEHYDRSEYNYINDYFIYYKETRDELERKGMKEKVLMLEKRMRYYGEKQNKKE